jgi:uncharacterized protein
MIDRKGITSFLLITFVLTYAIEGVLALMGFRWEGIPPILGQYTIMIVMWVPALATFITTRWVTGEGMKVTNLRVGRLKPYLVSALVIPLVFFVIYGLTWLLGLGQPDWNLDSLRQLMAGAGADISTMPPAPALLAAIFFSSLIIGPLVNGLAALGEEVGWRGYLLPKLMPLGKGRAYSLVGVIWGLWHAPLIWMGFNYPGYPLLGILWFCAVTTAMSIYINEQTLRNRSTLLAGWIHGAINGQAYGIWRILFPTVNPVLGGMTGLVGITVWLVVGWWTVRRGQAAPVDQTQLDALKSQHA